MEVGLADWPFLIDFFLSPSWHEPLSKSENLKPYRTASSGANAGGSTFRSSPYYLSKGTARALSAQKHERPMGN